MKTYFNTSDIYLGKPKYSLKQDILLVNKTKLSKIRKVLN